MNRFLISCMLADALFPMDPDSALTISHLPVAADAGLSLNLLGLPLGEMEFEVGYESTTVWVDGIRFEIETDF